jgi:hypothetical protein
LTTVQVALVDPDLDADDPVAGLGLGGPVVDVGTQGGQGHAAFALLRLAGHLGSAQAAVHLDLDALGAGLHGRLQGLLHRTAEGHALLEGLGDHLGDQGRLELGALDLAHGQVAGDAGDLLELLLELLDAHALAPDQHARARRVHDDVDRLAGALDLDARDASTLELLLDEATDVLVLLEQAAEVPLVGVPAGAPGFDDGDAVAGRVNFLSHGRCAGGAGRGGSTRGRVRIRRVP